MASNDQLSTVAAKHQASPRSVVDHSLPFPNRSPMQSSGNPWIRDYTWSRSHPIVFNSQRTYATKQPQAGGRPPANRSKSTSGILNATHALHEFNHTVTQTEELEAEIDDLNKTITKLNEKLSHAEKDTNAKIAQAEAKGAANATKRFQERLDTAEKTARGLQAAQSRHEQQLHDRVKQAKEIQKAEDGKELQEAVAAEVKKYNRLLKEKEDVVENEKKVSAGHVDHCNALQARIAEDTKMSTRRETRKNYTTYHNLFDLVTDTWEDGKAVFDLLESTAKRRLETDESSVDARTELTNTAVREINDSILECKDLLEKTLEARQKINGTLSEFRAIGHHQRRLMTLLRFEEAPTRYDVAKVAYTPMTEVYHRNSRSLPRDLLESPAFSRLEAFEGDLEKYWSLKALRGDSIEAKSAYLALEHLHEEYAYASRLYRQLGPASWKNDIHTIYKDKQNQIRTSLEEQTKRYMQISLLQRSLGDQSGSEAILNEQIDARIAVVEERLHEKGRKLKDLVVLRSMRIPGRARSFSAPASVDYPQASQRIYRPFRLIKNDIRRIVASVPDRKALKDNPAYNKLQVELLEAKILLFHEQIERQRNARAPNHAKIEVWESMAKRLQARIEELNNPSSSTGQVEDDPENSSAPSRGRSDAGVASRSASPRFRIRRTIGSKSTRRRYSCYGRMMEKPASAFNDTISGVGGADYILGSTIQGAQQQQHLMYENELIDPMLSPAYLDNSSCAESGIVEEQCSASSFEEGSSSSESDVSNSTTEERPLTLSFKIPLDVMQAAKRPAAESAATYWSYDLYRDEHNKTPARHYCKNLQRAEEQAASLLAECKPGSVLGFDLEWVNAHEFPGKSTVKRNVSLIQVATESKCLLFHVAVFVGDSVDDLMPPSLRKVLESPSIVKAGVNVAGDATRLRTNMNVQMRGLFELSQLYKVVKFSEKAPELVNKKLVKMETQVLEILSLPLDKTQSVRAGDWSRALSTQQIDYACSDAYAGFHLYHALNAERIKMDPTPPMPAYQELHRPLLLGNGKPAPKPCKVLAPGTSKTEELEEDEGEEEYFDALEEQEPKEEANTLSNVDEVVYPIAHPTSADAVEEAPAGSSPAPSLQILESSTTTSSACGTTHSATALPLQHADEWIVRLRSRLPAEHKLRAENQKQSTLRAYHLWYEQGHDMKSTAAFLRTPPLALTTVASYVMEAIREADLPYCFDRISEPLAVLPQAARLRYRRIIEQVELSQR